LSTCLAMFKSPLYIVPGHFPRFHWPWPSPESSFSLESGNWTLESPFQSAYPDCQVLDSADPVRCLFCHNSHIWHCQIYIDHISQSHYRWSYKSYLRNWYLSIQNP
jgi:hypothetical protein